jgi:hypothetical protein
VVDACKSGDAERFYHLTYPYDGYPDFWASAVRRIARSIPAVVRKFRKPFK